MRVSFFKKNIKIFWGKFLKDRIVQEVFALAFILNLFIWFFVYMKIKNIEGEVPLQYNFWGQALRVGKAKELFYYPLIGLIILLGNLILAFFNSAYFGRNKNNYFSYFVLLAALLANIFLFLGVFQVFR